MIFFKLGDSSLMTWITNLESLHMFLEKKDFIIFFIGLFKSHDLDREFDKIYCFCLTIINVVTSLSWSFFYIPFLSHFNIWASIFLKKLK
jgi:hypothetical protein